MAHGLFRRTEKGFDPNAYKLLAKAGYDPQSSNTLGRLIPEVICSKVHGLNQTKRMLKENGHSMESSRAGLGYKQDVKKAFFQKTWIFKEILIERRIGMTPCLDDGANNYRSIIPSRMRRETTFLVSCDSVLKAKLYTIVETRPKEEDEESVGSSNFVTFLHGTTPRPISRQTISLVREIERLIRVGYIQRDENISVENI
ncbi:hypothetical protein M9H77_26212 [Catharanthus roseus]|uniref:Uncharacterized protein n=1 Tax=Catharanthus roseus TaxID=4058 RepID=A0ACC0AB80_CATRO|nr:hypothetical protein M9H77_26212 [Catharanthus roseus]